MNEVLVHAFNDEIEKIAETTRAEKEWQESQRTGPWKSMDSPGTIRSHFRYTHPLTDREKELTKLPKDVRMKAADALEQKGKSRGAAGHGPRDRQRINVLRYGSKYVTHHGSDLSDWRTRDYKPVDAARVSREARIADIREGRESQYGKPIPDWEKAKK
jgi:hypothetical protein